MAEGNTTGNMVKVIINDEEYWVPRFDNTDAVALAAHRRHTLSGLPPALNAFVHLLDGTWRRHEL